MSFKCSLLALVAAASVLLVTATTQDPICVQIAGNVSSATDVYYAGTFCRLKAYQYQVNSSLER